MHHFSLVLHFLVSKGWYSQLYSFRQHLDIVFTDYVCNKVAVIAVIHHTVQIKDFLKELNPLILYLDPIYAQTQIQHNPHPKLTEWWLLNRLLHLKEAPTTVSLENRIKMQLI